MTSCDARDRKEATLVSPAAPSWDGGTFSVLQAVLTCVENNSSSYNGFQFNPVVMLVRKKQIRFSVGRVMDHGTGCFYRQEVPAVLCLKNWLNLGQ